MAQGTPNDENRIRRRDRVLKRGKILLTNKSSVVDCTIRDMSETGARIICGEQTAVPTEFRFMALGDNIIREAKVMWRRGDQAGIRFTGEARTSPRK
jgi:hypothetical protein